MVTSFHLFKTVTAKCTPLAHLLTPSYNLTSTMNSDQTYDYHRRYPYPEVFLVDRGESQHGPPPPPKLIPCWTFPPAQERVMQQGKSRGCMGVSTKLALVVLLLFMLVFASLGIGAVWIVNLQKEMKEVKRYAKPMNRSTEEPVKMETVIAPQKQIGLYEPWVKGEDKKDRPSAHVMVRIEEKPTDKTLKWLPSVGRAFTSGGVVYRTEDGSLQVNETGLFYIYCRVELVFRDCYTSSSFSHSVYVKRPSHPSPITLMKAHRQGFCPLHKEKAWTTDSYLGSVLNLQKHDRVLVNVSHPAYLSHEHYANFFGLYKI